MGSRRADAAIMEESPTFLFQDDELARVQAIVDRGCWIDYAGREYEVTHMTEGLGDAKRPGVKQWVVWGFRKQAA
jgi:hypothetical protein